MEKLRQIQLEVKGGKNNYNDFAKFNFRNAEQLFDSIKPLLVKYDCYMNVDNEIISAGDKELIKSTVTFIDGDYTKTASAYAGIEWGKKGMDYSQVCGCAQSYATKYALCSLLLLSDSKLDPDSHEPKDYNSNEAKPQQKNGVDFNDIDKIDDINELYEWYKINEPLLKTDAQKQAVKRKCEYRKKALTQNIH